MKRSLVAAAAIIALLVSAPQRIIAQVPDSCLKLLRALDTNFFNPDSVKVDSCNGSATFGSLFARQWFFIEFKYFAILPIAPQTQDTLIEVGWEDINTSFATIRNQFEALEEEYGAYILRKYIVTESDTSDPNNKRFLVQFSSYVNIDSVLASFDSIELADSYYQGRYGAPAFVTKDELVLSNFSVFPNPFSVELMLVNWSNHLDEVNIINMLGQIIESLVIGPSSSILISLRDQQSGVYFMRVGNKTMKVFKK